MGAVTEPEPETLESIELQGRMVTKGCVWTCGCERRNDRFYLCTFHQGFEDVLERARRVDHSCLRGVWFGDGACSEWVNHPNRPVRGGT